MDNNKQTTDTPTPCLMEQALGEQWTQLHPALQAHYQSDDNVDIGELDIEYPKPMQLYLNFMRLLGALINRRESGVPATVEKWMDGDTQRWKRTVTFQDDKQIFFKSHWQYAGDDELIEYVSPLVGLRMKVSVRDSKLYYEGVHYVIKLGPVKIPLPEWLILGHTTIEEVGQDDGHFTMDFRLKHPLFGQIYRYAGRFRTETKAD